MEKNFEFENSIKLVGSLKKKNRAYLVGLVRSSELTDGNSLVWPGSLADAAIISSGL